MNFLRAVPHPSLVGFVRAERTLWPLAIGCQNSAAGNQAIFTRAVVRKVRRGEEGESLRCGSTSADVLVIRAWNSGVVRTYMQWFRQSVLGLA